MKEAARAPRREDGRLPTRRANRLHGFAPPLAAAVGSAARCACGGGCPRCAASQVRVSAPGDALEQEAERLAGPLADEARHVRGAGGSERSRAARALIDAAGRRLGRTVDVRLHTGPEARRLAASFGARAFTVGRDVAFADGEYQPETERGRRLMAHELVHAARQPHAEAPIVQRQPDDVVEMEPLEVRSTLQPTGQAVPDLDRLTGEGVDPAEMTARRTDETIERNAPPATRRLPFTTGAWDAETILTSLGQYDRMPGTDSDAIRCVQAVAMASRIVDGPAAVAGFLRAMVLEGMMARAATPRQQTAIEALEHVIGRIETERATFGDLMWAQEALHDLFYNDVSGTPETEILDRMGPPLEMARSIVPMNTWCNSPQDVVTAAGQLQPGEQLLVNTWQVVFNTAFDQLSDEHGIEVEVGRSTLVEVNGRLRRIRRIDSSTRPAHTAIDAFRDLKTGHQLLVFKDGATGTLRLYEPEITETGRHLEDLAADGSNFQRYFQDLPDVGIYNYIQILGKLTPNALTSSSGWPAAAP